MPWYINNNKLIRNNWCGKRIFIENKERNIPCVEKTDYITRRPNLDNLFDHPLPRLTRVIIVHGIISPLESL